METVVTRFDELQSGDEICLNDKWDKWRKSSLDNSRLDSSEGFYFHKDHPVVRELLSRGVRVRRENPKPRKPKLRTYVDALVEAAKRDCGLRYLDRHDWLLFRDGGTLRYNDGSLHSSQWFLVKNMTDWYLCNKETGEPIEFEDGD